MLGIPLPEKFIGFLTFSFLVCFRVGFLVAWFQSFLVSEFLGFLVSKQELIRRIVGIGRPLSLPKRLGLVISDILKFTKYCPKKRLWTFSWNNSGILGSEKIKLNCFRAQGHVRKSRNHENEGVRSLS